MYAFISFRLIISETLTLSEYPIQKILTYRRYRNLYYNFNKGWFENSTFLGCRKLP